MKYHVCICKAQALNLKEVPQDFQRWTTISTIVGDKTVKLEFLYFKVNHKVEVLDLLCKGGLFIFWINTAFFHILFCHVVDLEITFHMMLSNGIL